MATDPGAGLATPSHLAHATACLLRCSVARVSGKPAVIAPDLRVARRIEAKLYEKRPAEPEKREGDDLSQDFFPARL